MLNKKPKVLFVTSLFSPFQIELAYEINKIGIFEYYVAFTIPYSPKRGKHWIVNIKDGYKQYIIVANDDMSLESTSIWAAKTIVKINPKIVISGFYKGPIFKQILKATKSIGAILGFWCESPNLLYPKLMVKIYQNVILKRNLNHGRFILAIGHRALKIYKEIFSYHVELIPYAQDLSLHFAIRRSPKSDNEMMTLLFSGQLVKRHNIHLIAKALVKLYKQYPNKFRFVIAAYGPEENVFLNIIGKEAELKKLIIYDRRYETWEDRVRPFSYSDVLVYPSKYSGWGLVVPEAMASGMLVISTPYVEAARYYIKNGVNGILIEDNLNEIVAAMEWCIHNKETVFEMGKRARIDAQEATAENVARQFCNSIRQYL